MVVPDGQAAGGVLGKAAELVAHALTDRFERLEAGGARCGMAKARLAMPGAPARPR